MDRIPVPEPLEPYLPFIVGVAAALVIFVIGWIASKWAHRLALVALRKRSVDEALARFLASIAQYAVLAAAVIAALGEAGVETTSLVAVFASAGLAIGLALQGSLGHFASGVMVLLFRPFTLGDTITASGHFGTVDDIGLFATTLVTLDNEKIIIPNGTVTGASIVNHTTLGTRRGAIDVGVVYGADVARVMQVLEQAAKGCDIVLDDPAPAVAFVGLGASSLDFKVFAWSKSDDYLTMLHDVRKAVYDALNAAGIEIPFSQIVVHQASS